MKFLLFIFTFTFLSCGPNDTKQKELELKERELALKEKEFALKQSDSSINGTAVAAEPKKDTAQKLPADTKVLTLMSPTYFFGDVAHLSFKDYTTHKESEYEWDGEIAALNEILKKCDGHEGCPALKGQVYSATLKFKLMDIYDFDKEGVIGPTGKKEKRWAIVALKKIDKP